MSRNRNHARRTPKSNPRGVLRVHPAGYGFVLTAEGEFFVAAGAMRGAFDGDVVEVAPLKAQGAARQGGEGGGGAGRGAGGGRGGGAGGAAGQRRGAKVVGVLDRAHTSIVGRVELAEPFAVVIPADPHLTHDIFTMHADAPHVTDGAIVRVTMVTYPDRNSAATGVITEVISGTEDAAALDMILARYHLDRPFSEAAVAQANAARLDVSAALAHGYRDLRQRVVCTIDPVDARDYDDAVSCEELLGGACRVGVHIADVSAYVPWDSALDVEARTRGTSVYAVDRVIPMLPEALSNDLCSLVAGKDRLTLTVDMTVSAAGHVTHAEIYPAVICSAARLTYEDAQRVIDAEEGQDGEGAPLAPSGTPLAPLCKGGCQGRAAALTGGLPSATTCETAPSHDASSNLATIPPAVRQTILHLHRIAQRRLTLARERGALDFDRAEAKVQLDATGAPTGVTLRRKTAATSLIEECMIMANEAVAQFLTARRHPGAFRVHERPDVDALDALLPTFSRFAWFAGISHGDFALGEPRTLAEVLARAHDAREFEVVSMLLLRAMKRACYRASDDGHYGLALAHYAHFTSPIRRYPDLVVHRMCKAALGLPAVTGAPGATFGAQVAALPAICAHASHAETVAEDAARETQEYKLIEYLQRFVGQSFPGVISGITAHGLYVRLENTAEGSIALSDLGHEFFSLDATATALLGESTGRTYRLGDALSVVIAEATPKTRTLRFKLAK